LPTGKLHYLMETADSHTDDAVACRCVIGEDHDEDGALFAEGLSADEANDIYLSSGMDEDYDFR
jgi:hypothetical protein